MIECRSSSPRSDYNGLRPVALNPPIDEPYDQLCLQVPSIQIPRRCAVLETTLRQFRARELANRQVPGRLATLIDVWSRLIPLFVGYLLTLFLPFPENIAAVSLFAVADVAMLGSWFHDSVHVSVKARTAKVKLLGRIGSAPVGFSPRWWFYKHVKMHHRYVNNPEFDPDIQFGYLARLSGSQRWHALHSTQHIHMWPLLPFATINMLKPNEIWGVQRLKLHKGIGTLPPTWVFLLDKYAPLTIAWIPVLYFQGPRHGAICFLVFQLIAGTLVSIITQVQHNTALADDSDDYSTRWPLCEQLARTTDVGVGRGMWWWLSGGTNFHVAHHIIPTLSFLELPAVTARLRAELSSIGIPFPVHENIGAAIKSHVILLRRLGRRPASMPVIKERLWSR
jgi:linoleoyl-CoA desaturase